MDDEATFYLKLPAFVLFSGVDRTPLVHKEGSKKLVPLFTDDDAVKTFVDRALKSGCLIETIPDGESLERFLSGFRLDDAVLMDPIDDQFRTQTAYTVGQILASIRRGKQ